MNLIIKTALAATTLLIASPALAAGDPVAGKEKAVVCFACHGEDGNATVAMYPKLAGQWQDYMVRALKEYKSGKRTDPVMAGMVANLSEQDMEDISAYFAKLPGQLDDLHLRVQGD